MKRFLVNLIDSNYVSKSIQLTGNDISCVFRNIRLIYPDYNVVGIEQMIRAKKTDSSKREEDILSQLRLGKTNKQIANAIGVSPDTVKTYMRGLFKKYKVNTRTALVIANMTSGSL
jgi:DNA-binding NarL/FixJ family response regulator